MNKPENFPDIPGETTPEQTEFIKHLTIKLCRIIKKQDGIHISDLSNRLTTRERAKYKQVVGILLEEGALVFNSRWKNWTTGETRYLELAPQLKNKLANNPDLLICFCTECAEKRWNKFQRDLRLSS